MLIDKEGLTIPEVLHCVGTVIFLNAAALSEAEAGGQEPAAAVETGRRIGGCRSFTSGKFRKIR